MHTDMFPVRTFKLKSNRPCVKNVKIHFKLLRPLHAHTLENQVRQISSEQCEAKRHNNYYVIRNRDSKLIYTVFTNSKHVNITGIKGFNCIQSALAHFNKDFNQNIKRSQVVVDNSTASGKFFFIGPSHKNQPVDCDDDFEPFFPLQQIKFLVDHHLLFQHMRFSLAPAGFPGGVIRISGWPTAILFASGRFTIVGGKSNQKIRETYSELCFCVRIWKQILGVRRF